VYLDLLQPVLALVGLTFLVWLRLFMVRVPLIMRRQIDVNFYVVKDGAPPPPIERAPTHHLANLFEMPVLFYALVALTIACGATDPTTVTLAWAYVGLRGLHALIHLTYNLPNHRFVPYFLSCAVLLVMWLRFAGWAFAQG
jgi:hypothetical protein